MFRPKTVLAHCAETSVSAIVEVLKHPFLQSLKFGLSVPKHPFLQSCAETSLYYLRIICVACHSIASNVIIMYVNIIS